MLDQGVASPGVRFEVHGLDPPDHSFHPLTEFRCAAQVIRHALEAEKAGYDAFVIGHFQEPGLLEIRGSVDIPVIGLGEANLLAAPQHGTSAGPRDHRSDLHPLARPAGEHARARRAGASARPALKMNLPAFMKAFTDEAAYADRARPVRGPGASR